MRRRDFVSALLAGALAPAVARAGEALRDVRITRIVGFDLISRRAKFCGKNARRDDHGDLARDRMVRLYTNTDHEGLGNCWVSKQVLAGLAGSAPFEPYDAEKRRFGGPLGTQTMPLWDLLGKVLEQPVYRLLGGRGGPGRVPVYDGSFYFSDLVPKYRDKWQDRFKEEIDLSLKMGHRALKVKIGRGNRWMDRPAGDARDVEVVELIRRHGGKDLVIGADANDGYQPDGAKEFLRRAGPAGLAFIEEPFPEDVEQCLDLKRFIAGQGWKTLLADGETQKDLDAYVPLVRAGAIDVLQGDMNGFGIEGVMAMAALGRPQGVLIAPHNWGSRVGFTMQLHVARAVGNFYRAEHDPLHGELLTAEGYTIAEGQCRVPDLPGFGLAIDEERFRDVKVLFDLKA